jgi:hypothetical protein
MQVLATYLRWLQKKLRPQEDKGEEAPVPAGHVEADNAPCVEEDIAEEIEKSHRADTCRRFTNSLSWSFSNACYFLVAAVVAHLWSVLTPKK